MSDGVTPEQAKAAVVARGILKLRRRRDGAFGEGLFADPCWDMLLDLIVAEAESRAISVSSLCVAAAVPQTTALRWIRILERNGLVQRGPHPRDARGKLVSLTPDASAKLRKLLADS